MSLARGEDLVHEGLARSPVVTDVPAVVIAITPSMEERLRVAQLNAHAPVLLVSTREEAVALLTGGASSPPLPRTEPPIETVVAEPLGGPVAESVPGAEIADQPPGLPQPVEPGSVERVHGPVGLVVDSDWRVLRWEGRSVPLSPLEHDLLVCLLADSARTWTFEHIHRQVWGNDHLGGRDDVQSVVKRLRRKLRELGSPCGIHAVRGIGLRLVDERLGGVRDYVVGEP
jgi:Transcriptional regulatory protein, C terminal